MPRSAVSRTALTTLKKQATRVLASLRREIGQREKDLALLKQEAQRWQNAVSGRPAARNGAVLGRGERVRSRLDWKAVLSELPDTFTPKDVAQKTGKPMEQVYAGLSRWAKDKKVRKGKSGYQKMPASSAR